MLVYESSLGLKSHVHLHASLKNSKKEILRERNIVILEYHGILYLYLDYLNQRSKNPKNEIKNHTSKNNLTLRDDLGT